MYCKGFNVEETSLEMFLTRIDISAIIVKKIN